MVDRPIIEPGATMRTREGYDVLITHRVEIPWSYDGDRRLWLGWGGIFYDDGSKCTWELDGHYSKVWTGWEHDDAVGGNELDLTERVS